MKRLAPEQANMLLRVTKLKKGVLQPLSYKKLKNIFKMSKLGYTWFPQDWWTSDTFKRLKRFPMVRYTIRELIDLMYSEGKPIKMNREYLSDDLNISLSDEEFSKLMEYIIVDENGLWWFDSVKKRISRADASRQNGKKGGAPRGNKNAKKEEQKEETKTTQEPSETTQENNLENPPYKSKYKLNKNINRYCFVSIQNLNEFTSTFEGNKTYFLLAFRFWELWKKENPKHKHLEKADVFEWVDQIRLLIENDGNSIDRMIGILKYFDRCHKQDSRFDSFWFKNMSTLKALRKVDRNGVSKTDTIAKLVNDAGIKYQDFDQEVVKSIKKIKEHESTKTPG